MPSPLVSLIIPAFNAGKTLGRCLEAALASEYDNLEVIVVDDCSSDNTAAVAGDFSCICLRLKHRAGAAGARNHGAGKARGEILFFVDADCLLTKPAVALAADRSTLLGPRIILGGTYTPQPADPGFYSAFQSVFINHFETKNLGQPDYIASHAMVIHASAFRESGGFPDNFMPILEDVEFSHRLRRQGFELRMCPEILVRHIFNFTLVKSLANAARKSRFWTRYSLKNKDLFADSGTASIELKLNGMAWLSTLICILLALLLSSAFFALAVLPVQACNLWVQRRLFLAFKAAGNTGFASVAALYYLLVYPAAVFAGSFLGVTAHFFGKQH